jgi:hypothetical protein
VLLNGDMLKKNLDTTAVWPNRSEASREIDCAGQRKELKECRTRLKIHRGVVPIRVRVRNPSEVQTLDVRPTTEFSLIPKKHLRFLCRTTSLGYPMINLHSR